MHGQKAGQTPISRRLSRQKAFPFMHIPPVDMAFFFGFVERYIQIVRFFDRIRTDLTLKALSSGRLPLL
jgi:hypothetical protein